MKKIYSLLFITLVSAMIISGISKVYSQCEPYIKIDGDIVIANETVPSGLVLPIWLKAGQTLSVGLTVKSISVIEFTENNNALEYSQVLSITSSAPVQVPAGKVWKVESIVKNPQIAGGTNKVEYNMRGTSTFTVPTCAEYICIEVWGAGGGGQASQSSSPYMGAGGGGGAYGQQCFVVSPSTNYTVTVGIGGNGGTTSGGAGAVGGATSVSLGAVNLIIANGGSGGVTAGGNGGTSTASLNVPGFKGLVGVMNPGSTSYGYGGKGGYGANGGEGGTGLLGANGTIGKIPGGGGSGAGANGSTIYTGGTGADGKVVIYW